MSTPPPYPQPPQYPGYQFPPPRRRNKALPWLVGGAVVVIAALVVTLVLVLSGDDDDKSGGGTASAGGDYDLSTPEKAAESIAAAAKAGDVDAFLKLTCVGTPQCVEAQGEDATQQDVEDMRERITQGLDEFADQLDGVEFGEARAASRLGVMEVPYTTPDMVQGEERGLTFVRVDGKWLWFGSSGGNSGGGGAGSEGGGGHPGDASVEPDPHEPTTEETTVSCPPTAPDTDDNPFPTQPPVEGC